ncbi:MAG: hypothetical protein QOC79_1349, partial [Actinomycetota bacterium]|nr:hypothetical protein [Actinomycetota bacterium]
MYVRPQNERARGSVWVRLAVAVALVTAVVAVGPPAGAAPTWSVVASPSPVGPPSGSLTSVSCPSADRCFAVGSYDREGTAAKTLIERWNGTRWSVVPSPNPVGASDSVLNGVSCLTTTSCFAVGKYADSSSLGKTLVEQWNGSTWSIVTSPNPTGTAISVLNGVSCASTTSCFAVGQQFLGSTAPALAERWNGTSWSIVPTPRPTAGTNTSRLLGVSCPSAASCYAVGDYYDGGPQFKTLVQHWNGGGWSVMPSPNPSSTNASQLNGVSCPTTTRCFAVGNFSDASGANETLVEHLNGSTWFIVASPNLPVADDLLNSVSCLSTTRCYAVGTHFGGSAGTTLTMRWNGTSWSLLPSPNPSPNPPGGASRILTGVSCRPGSCYAVGRDDTNTLVLHWDSTTWSIAAPPPSTSQSRLGQVACPSITSCFAVGGYDDGVTNKTLAERWNGTSWSIVTSPNPSGAADSFLNGVSCPSTTSCFAVGHSFDGATTKTLVERWNGTSWSIMSSPNVAGAPNAYGSSLNSVSCPSITSCYAVGNSF